MRRILIVLLAIVATSPAVGQAPDETPDESGVREVIAGLVNAWTAGDGERWSAAFVEDADFVVLSVPFDHIIIMVKCLGILSLIAKPIAKGEFHPDLFLIH